jgi:hypothetical protein
MNPVLAVVWLPDGVSKSVPTFPGQRLSFVGGKAEVRHAMHMPHVLAMPNARVQVSKDWREWLPGWIEQIPGVDDRKVKATVEYEGADDEQAPIHASFDHIVFGKHPSGHDCGFCQAARRRAVAAAMSNMEPVAV